MHRVHRFKRDEDFYIMLNHGVYSHQGFDPIEGKQLWLFAPCRETAYVVLFEKIAFTEYVPKGAWQLDVGTALEIPLPKRKTVYMDARDAFYMRHVKRELEIPWEHIRPRARYHLQHDTTR